MPSSRNCSYVLQERDETMLRGNRGKEKDQVPCGWNSPNRKIAAQDEKGPFLQDRGGRLKRTSTMRTFSSVQFSRSVVSNSLRPHESQHARPPCSSPTPGVHSDSCPLTDEWIKTMWSIHTMKYYSALREENPTTCYNREEACGLYTK